MSMLGRAPDTVMGSSAMKARAAFQSSTSTRYVDPTKSPPSAKVVPTAKMRSEEHTSELQSLMRISYAVFCLKKKTKTIQPATYHSTKQKLKDKETIQCKINNALSP